MRYFTNPTDGQTYGYDPTKPGDAALMQSQAIASGWLEVTGSWPPALTLAQAQASQIAVLNAAYQAAIVAPVSFRTAAGTTANFPQSNQAKQYLAQCMGAGAAAWTLNLWLDVNNTPVSPFTFADLQGLAAAFEAAEIPEYQDLLTKVAAVQAATTVAAAQAVTF